MTWEQRMAQRAAAREAERVRKAQDNDPKLHMHTDGHTYDKYGNDLGVGPVTCIVVPEEIDYSALCEICGN